MFMFNWLFKIVVAFCLAAQSEVLVGKELSQDGWVTLEKPISRLKEPDVEENESVWVIFSKKLGEESFRLRFPKLPEYRYLETKEMQVSSKVEDREFSLQVLKPVSLDEFMKVLQEMSLDSKISLMELVQKEENIYDVQYQEGQRTVFQRFYFSSHYLYVLETKGSFLDAESHAYFVNSFEVF